MLLIGCIGDDRLRHNEDRVVNSKYEGERLSALCQQEEEQMGKLTSLLDIIDRCLFSICLCHVSASL